jgi:hypothetical protein
MTWKRHKAVILKMIQRRAARTGRPSQSAAEQRFRKKMERYLELCGRHGFHGRPYLVFARMLATAGLAVHHMRE